MATRKSNAWRTWLALGLALAIAVASVAGGIVAGRWADEAERARPPTRLIAALPPEPPRPMPAPSVSGPDISAAAEIAPPLAVVPPDASVPETPVAATRPSIPTRPPRPAPSPSGPARIALVFDDMGVDRRLSAEVIALPGPLTVSFLPYAEHLTEQVSAAKRAGHEVMLHLPMEPEGRASPGPNALLMALDDDEIRRRLVLNLDRFSGYVGVNNHMGSRFTADAAKMGLVIAVLHERGLFFLDSRTSPRSVGLAVARAAGVPSIARDVFLDHDPRLFPIEGQLRETVAIARKHGQASAIGHPHPGTIAAVRAWLEARDPGLVLVSVSSLLPSAATAMRLN